MADVDMFPSAPVTTVSIWTVKPGREQVFVHLIHEVHKAVSLFPGHMGVTMLRSPTQKGSFQSILRFDTPEHLEAWLHSPVRQKMIQSVEEVAHRDTFVKATGLESWFEIPGQQVTPPPRWKMVITTTVAIYPLSLLFAFFGAPLFTSWPTEMQALVAPVIIPIVLTYFFMPFLTQRILKRWLYK